MSAVVETPAQNLDAMRGLRFFGSLTKYQVYDKFFLERDENNS